MRVRKITASSNLFYVNQTTLTRFDPVLHFYMNGSLKDLKIISLDELSFIVR